MEKKLKLAGIAVCLIAGCYLGSQQKNECSTLMSENIEALASGEHTGIIRCYGIGSVDCDGFYCKMRIEGLSLE